MNQPYDVLIIGGGLIGLTVSLGLAKRNFRVAVIDQGSLTEEVKPSYSRVYAVNHASEILLTQLRVWPKLDAAQIAPYRHMHVWDEQSTACIDFDARQAARKTLGCIVEEAAIKQALIDCLQQEENVSFIPFTKIIAIEQHPQMIMAVSKEKSWQAQFLIAADGGSSPVRQLLNVPVTTWPYHQHALVTTVTTEKPHQHTAYQLFKENGPLAFLPLINENQCSIVWSTTPKQAASLMVMPAEKFNQQLSNAFQHKLGKVSLAAERYQFPLIMRHARQYTGNNWLLMGDAAHTIHPLAGLGLNIGFADISVLLSLLDNGWPHKSFTKIAKAYQRQRKHAVWQSIALLGALKTLFANPLPPVVALRGLGLDLCNRFLPIKRLLIEQAAGTISSLE